jgi:hypothetical protein
VGPEVLWREPVQEKFLMVREEPREDLLSFRLGQGTFRVNGAIDGNRLGDTSGADLETV